MAPESCADRGHPGDLPKCGRGKVGTLPSLQWYFIEWYEISRIMGLPGKPKGFDGGEVERPSYLTPSTPVARDEPADAHSLARMMFLSSG